MVTNTPSVEKSLHDLDVKGQDIEHREDNPDATGSSPPDSVSVDLEYKDENEEPVLHRRTYFALLALFLLNYTQVVALNGPPSVLTYLGKDVDGVADQTWVPNALSLVQAVGGPVISFASDTFQARKTLLVATCTVSFIGAAIAPGAKDIYRVIVAQILIGVGFAAVPLAYAIPSEILPRKWRPLAQSLMNVAASLGAASAPLIAGALTEKSTHSGWRNFYWIQMAMWGLTVIGLLVGYRPPKRHSGLDHLSLWQKIGRLDLPGMALLSGGVTLLLVGLSLGDNPWPWTSARVMSTLVIGIALLIAFGLYEWKGTKVGILHHDLFERRTFPLCVALMFCEGVMLFSIILFYPAVTEALFETDPFLSAARQITFWLCSGAATVVYGFWSSKRRTIRSPLIVGFTIFAAGLVGMATIQPGQSTNAIVFDGLAGIGFAAPLILLIAGVQLSTPHHLIATATAVLTSSRAVAASVFTAIYSATVNSATSVKLPKHVAAAAIAAGLPPQYVTEFVGDLLSENSTALESIPGVTPAIIQAGAGGVLQGLADSFRLVYIIAAPFGVLACVLAYFLDDLTKLMNYRVDAPVEELHARHKAEETTA